MSETRSPTPPGVLAHLIVQGGRAACDFYARAFGATDIEMMPAKDGERLMYARMRLNDGILMLSDDFPEFFGGRSQRPPPGEPTGTILHIQVADADAAYARAIEAGASPLMPPADMFWGDRYGQVRDPFGHRWSIAHTLKT